MAIITKTATGAEMTVYVQGEDYNCNGEPCYRVSKVAGSPYVFLVRKSACRPA